MNEISNIFKKEKEDYKFTLDPINDYINITSKFINTISSLDNDSSKDFLNNYIKDNKVFKDPKVMFYERNEYGDKTKQVSTLSSYLKYVKESKSIIAPSFTLYFNTDKMKSLHSEFIGVNVSNRSVYKKNAFKYKMENDFEKFNFYNILQKSMKIFNNSLSGAYASAGTVLNNPTSHYTLTSVTRCLSGIGNMLSEMVISGNRHYKDPDVTINHIATLAYNADKPSIEKAIKDFNLHLPTADEVMDIILKSSRKYWKDLKKELLIYKYLKKLPAIERAYIAYNNDLYHIRVYNNDLMHDVITDMIEYELLDSDLESNEYIIKNAEEWIYNFAIHILSEELKGKKVDKYTAEDKLKLASVIFNLNAKFIKYSSLFKTFFVTETFPISIGTVKEMVREAIVLSDTDSTCASYSEWAYWYFKDYDYSPKSIAVTASVMTVVSQAVDHYIKLFGTNLNIKYEETKVLSMKNEFFWKVFVNTNVSKHYFADIFIQEGNIFDLDKLKTLEKKGVHLIAPNAYKPIRDLATNIMVDIMEKVFNNEKIYLQEYLDKVIEAESIILEKLKVGSPEVLKLEKIKQEKAYKKDKEESPYLHYLLWQEVFADKYGNAPDPTYMAIKVPTTIDNKNKMSKAISEIKDKELGNRFNMAMKKYNKTHIAIFRFPLINIYSNGLPEEIINIIDYKRVILDNCKVLYIILETLGFYLKEDETLTGFLSRD